MHKVLEAQIISQESRDTLSIKISISLKLQIRYLFSRESEVLPRSSSSNTKSASYQQRCVGARGSTRSTLGNSA